MTLVLHQARPKFGLSLETLLCVNGERVWITSLLCSMTNFLPAELFSENVAELAEYNSLEWPNNVVGHIYYMRFKTAYKETMTFLMAAKYLPIHRDVVQIIARKLYAPERVEIKF